MRFRFSTAFMISVCAMLASFHTSYAQNVDVDNLLETCLKCHGDNGVPVTADVPIIAGQEYYYLYVQLKDYKAERRTNPIMSILAKDLSKDQMKALAEYFSSIEWPPVASDIDNSLVDAGINALVAGQCSQCHSTYQGDSRVPRLAGQQLIYLQQTMNDFKHKVRLNSPAKGSLMVSFSEEDIAAMSHRLSGM